MSSTYRVQSCAQWCLSKVKTCLVFVKFVLLLHISLVRILKNDCAAVKGIFIFFFLIVTVMVYVESPSYIIQTVTIHTNQKTNQVSAAHCPEAKQVDLHRPV